MSEIVEYSSGGKLQRAVVVYTYANGERLILQRIDEKGRHVGRRVSVRAKNVKRPLAHEGIV